MKHLALLLLLSLAGLVAAWGPEDHEIFRVRDELIAGEGEDITFYDFMGVPPTATLDDINKAYRKKSVRLHPDKAIPSLLAKRSKPTSTPKDKKKPPGVRVQKGPSQRDRDRASKEANDRYARLGLVAAILRGPRRDRYDHFLRHGFPRWRGTGYYYARFRPGLGSVLAGLLIVAGGAVHYGAMYIGWRRQRDFVQRYVSHARRMAWGNEAGIPGIPAAPVDLPQADGDADGPAAPLNRREKRAQEKESRKKNNNNNNSTVTPAAARAARAARANGISGPVDAQLTSGPQGAKKKVIAENGKVLIVDSVGNVFLEEDTDEGDRHEFLLDPDEIPPPTLSQTILVRLPVFLYAQTLGRVLAAKAHDLGGGEGAEEPVLDPDGRQKLEISIAGEGLGEGEAVDAAAAGNASQEARKRRAKAKR